MAERTVSATEARVHFGELLDSVVHNLDIVFVQRSGVPQAVVIPVQLWRERQQEEDPWTAAARRMEAHWKYLEESRSGRPTAPDVAALLREAREERDEQLLGPLRGQ